LYFIHYNGWNERWDEWVDDTSIMEINEENLKHQKLLLAKAKKTEKTTKIPLINNNNNNNNQKKAKVSKGKATGKRKHSEAVKDDYDTLKVKIPILMPLRKKLVEDWGWVNTQRELVPLPRTPNVSNILDEFAKQCPDMEQDEAKKQIVRGLKEYFEEDLGVHLLYRFERTQYKMIIKKHPNTRLSEIYGVEHLLRLIVKLPYVVSNCEMEEKTIEVIKTLCTDLMKFIKKKREHIFPNRIRTCLGGLSKESWGLNWCKKLVIVVYFQ